MALSRDPFERDKPVQQGRMQHAQIAPSQPGMVQKVGMDAVGKATEGGLNAILPEGLGGAGAGTIGENIGTLGNTVSSALGGTGAGLTGALSSAGSGIGAGLSSAAGALGAGGAGLGAAAGGLGAAAMAAAPIALPALAAGKLFNLFRDGTTDVPDHMFGMDPLVDLYGEGGVDNLPDTQMTRGYRDGTVRVRGSHIAGYADGTQSVPMAPGPQGSDTVPAMLTPGEAVIPAPAAQDPANQAAIAGMVDQGQQMNQGMEAPSPMMGQGGPLGNPQDLGYVPSGMSLKDRQEMDKLQINRGKASMEEMRKDLTLQNAERRKDEMHQLQMQQKQEAHADRKGPLV